MAVVLVVLEEPRDSVGVTHHLEVHYQQLAEVLAVDKVPLELQVDLAAVPWVDIVPVMVLHHKDIQDLQHLMMVLVAVALVALEHLLDRKVVEMPMVG